MLLTGVSGTTPGPPSPAAGPPRRQLLAWTVGLGNLAGIRRAGRGELGGGGKARSASAGQSTLCECAMIRWVLVTPHSHPRCWKRRASSTLPPGPGLPALFRGQAQALTSVAEKKEPSELRLSSSSSSGRKRSWPSVSGSMRVRSAEGVQGCWDLLLPPTWPWGEQGLQPTPPGLPGLTSLSS